MILSTVPIKYSVYSELFGSATHSTISMVQSFLIFELPTELVTILTNERFMEKRYMHIYIDFLQVSTYKNIIKKVIRGMKDRIFKIIGN